MASSSSRVVFALAECVVFFFSFSASVLIKIQNRQPKPYMDEIFHIPQVQKYCQGNFTEWDPMITTLPGLYISTITVLQLIVWVLNIPITAACSTFYLRGINVLFATGNLILLWMLVCSLQEHQKGSNKWRCLVTASTLSVFPVLYFCTFLYYTDAGSTFCVLLMYLWSIRGQHTRAAAAGSAAVLFRQTNVVWVVFVAGLVAEQQVLQWIQPAKKEISKEKLESFEFISIILKQVWNSLNKDTKSLKTFLTKCVNDLWGYALVCVTFVVFVFVNGGIVVGAKTDHQVSMHFPQVYYFVTFAAGFSFMHLISLYKVKDFLRFLIRHPLFTIIFCTVSFLLIWKFTFAHRYLLADNRHYTFYVWAKVFRRHELVKYCLVPVYLYCSWAIAMAVKHQSFLWKLIYFVCICVNLVPQMLLEFRYFIIPYLVFRLNMKPASYLKLVLEILVYIAVNAATLFLFFEKTFKWPNSNDLQRFMW